MNRNCLEYRLTRSAVGYLYNLPDYTIDEYIHGNPAEDQMGPGQESCSLLVRPTEKTFDLEGEWIAEWWQPC